MRRDGDAVSITPKMFELLLVLVRNDRKVLDKDFLLQNVWPDTFVEEGNISFNIRQLRKALGDDAQSPTYIETVKRRGYRFIAKVEVAEINANPSPVLQHEIESLPEQISGKAIPSKRKKVYSVVALSAVLLSVMAIGGRFLVPRTNQSSFAVLNLPFSSEKLSTTGGVFSAAISPDGKKVVYSSRAGSAQGIWLRDLETGTNVQFIPASEENYYEIAFSPDGNSIYFARRMRGIEKRLDIFRASVFGGIPEMIVGGTEGVLGISPDGNKISFVRCPNTDEEWCSLWIADAKDGKNERKLTSRPKPIRIADNEISPDGKRIAFAVGHSRNQANEFRLMEIDIETLAEHEITAERFFNIKNLSWLPDQSGLLLTAARIPNKYFRIWRVTSSSGISEPLTKDSEAYSIVSLNKAANLLVSTQIKQDFRIYDFSIENPSDNRLLADGARGSYGADGKIYFSSTMSGNDEIWSINPDGTEQRQLTNNPAGDGNPITSPDGKTVFFTSNRSGQAHLWQMNADGSNQTQLTHTEGGSSIFVSPDGKLLYYRHAIHGTIWSVSLESNEEKVFFDQVKPFFALSPDGSMIAFEERKGDILFLTLFSPSDGRKISSFEMPRERAVLVEIAWHPDGKSLMCLMADANYNKNAVYRQPIDGEPIRKILELEDASPTEANSLTVSPDGKRLAVVQGGWKHDAVLIRGLK